MERINTYTYDYNNETITMNFSHSVEEWEIFFDNLIMLDALSPLYVMMYYFSLLFDTPRKLPAMPCENLFGDVAIEIASDDRYPAFEAAVNSGFIAEGLSLLIALAKRSPYTEVLQLAWIRGYIDEYASEEDVDRFCKQRLTLPPANVDQALWELYLTELMRTDPGAPTSILSYYLDEINDYSFRVYCPLEDEEYEIIGSRMHEAETVLEAACASGLMATAIPRYFCTALDTADNWNLMSPGMQYLLNHKTLHRFIPFKNKYLATNLLKSFDLYLSEDEETQWEQRVDELLQSLDGKVRGE